jgi:hypothetical protein
MFQFASAAEQFRAKATVCFARSKRVPDPEYQRIFYDLAVEWLAWPLKQTAKRKRLADSTDALQGDPPPG